MAYKGLLVTPEDKQDAAFQGLLKLGANLMAAGGYSDKPVSMGQALASGTQGYLDGYQGHLKGVKQDQFQGMQATSAQQQIDMNNQKMAAAKATQENDKKFMDWYNSGGVDAMGNPVDAPMTPEMAKKQYTEYYGAEDQLQRQMDLERFKSTLKPKGPTFNTVQNPFGKGGVGQRNSSTGKIENYQAPKISNPVPGRDVPLGEDVMAQKVEIAKANAANRPITESESKAGTFALRMDGATSALNSIEAGPDGKVGTADDFDPTSKMQHTLAQVPGVGNMLIDDDHRAYRQAQEDWVTANLRKESGAVIGADEMKQEISKYFPLPGDDLNTIRQKVASRKAAETGMRVTAGKAYGQMSDAMGGNPFDGFKIVGSE